MGNRPIVSSAGPHFGEESCLVGRGGSGTIFLAGCNLSCVFCQNYDISHLRQGTTVDVGDLVQIMSALERRGCENINFVSPTHVAPHLLDAVVQARNAGLRLPIVWNCGGYDSVEMLQLLAGHVDIYMPDIKYADDAIAERFSKAKDYGSVVQAAIREMHGQVGDLIIEGGMAMRGLLVRHLVLPNDVAGSRQIIDFLADEISPDTFVNVMGQYRPQYQADRHIELARCTTRDEVAQIEECALQRGLRLAD